MVTGFERRMYEDFSTMAKALKDMTKVLQEMNESLGTVTRVILAMAENDGIHDAGEKQ